MKTLELRIGNLIQHEWIGQNGKLNNYIMVEFIRQKFISVNSNRLPEYETIYEDDLKPIPLTGDWLIRLGFELKDITTINETVFVLGRAWMSKDLKSLWLCKFKKGENHAELKAPKYVHKLQNLFYALTGEELTINN